MRSHQALAPSARRRVAGRVAAGAVAMLALALLWAWAGQVPPAFASSAGTVGISPGSGPIGTPVEVDVNLYPATPQAYVLSATTTDPTQGGCSSAQPIPGVGPVTVGQQGGHVQFDWPAALGVGTYWLCAAPQNGAGQTIHSILTFIVTPADAPTATPVSGGYLDTSATSVSAPPGGVPAGSTVIVVVNGWKTPNNAGPVSVKLEGNSTTVDVPFTAAPIDSSQDGAFKLTVTIPATTQPGPYGFEIDGAYHVTTLGFQVIAPPAAVSVPGTPTTNPPGSGLPPVALLAALVAVLALAGFIVVPMLVRRGRR